MMSLCDMELDPYSRAPLHVQVELALAAQIGRGDLRPGARLPSEDALTERYLVSRTTVRSAIRSLISRGLVEIRRGTGTFVTRPAIAQELVWLAGFTADRDEDRLETSVKLLDRRLVAASETVARQLGLERGAEVTRIQRVRVRVRVRDAQDAPISVDETYVNRELGAKLVGDDLERESPLFLLEHKYEIPVVESHYRLATVAVHGTVSRALGIDAGNPILLVERSTYSEDDFPVGYERLYCRGDHIAFITRTMNRPSNASRR
jgi:GntR family transcriptional regulator